MTNNYQTHVREYLAGSSITLAELEQKIFDQKVFLPLAKEAEVDLQQKVKTGDLEGAREARRALSHHLIRAGVSQAQALKVGSGDTFCEMVLAETDALCIFSQTVLHKQQEKERESLQQQLAGAYKAVSAAAGAGISRASNFFSGMFSNSKEAEAEDEQMVEGAKKQRTKMPKGLSKKKAADQEVEILKPPSCSSYFCGNSLYM